MYIVVSFAHVSQCANRYLLTCTPWHGMCLVLPKLIAHKIITTWILCRGLHTKAQRCSRTLDRNGRAYLFIRNYICAVNLVVCTRAIHM